MIDKFEEMEKLIHYFKFEMWQAIFYIKSPYFPNSSIDSKLEFLNGGFRLHLIFENVYSDMQFNNKQNK